jgi:hypothetical protein
MIPSTGDVRLAELLLITPDHPTIIPSDKVRFNFTYVRYVRIEKIELEQGEKLRIILRKR